VRHWTAPSVPEPSTPWPKPLPPNYS
jgi:hypothetical protein